MKMKGAEILIETLIDQGVTDVFGYPGGTVLDIYDAIYKYQDRIHHVLTTHEQHAAHAADGYARSTGKVGVCIATSGPGSTNLVTGIATAMLDSIPLVAITGNVGRAMIGKDSFQEVDITGITLPITKHNYFVNDVNKLEETIREAFKIAKSGRPGPVLIDIPKDIQTSIGDFQPKGVVSPFSKIAPSQNRIKEAADLINQAEKPYIYIGGGVITTGVYDEVKELAEKIDAVIGTSLMGISAIDTDYDRFLGMEGMHGHFASSMAQDESDCIIALGTRFSDRATGNVNKFAKQASIIHMDVDFAEINKNVKTDVGVRGDISLSLPELIATVDKAKHPEWISHVNELRRKEKALEPKDVGVTPHAVMEVINDVRNPDSPVVTDVGQHQMWAAQYLKFSKPRTFITSGGLGTMGFGVGASIGTAIGTRQHTILITGDGSFSMNMSECLTAVENKLPLTIVVLNNGVLGMVRQWQTLFYGKRYSNTVLTGRQVDYVKLAEAYGAKGVVTLTMDAFRDAFTEAYNSNDVTIIDCRIDKDEFVLPMLPPGGSVEEMITEKGADI